MKKIFVNLFVVLFLLTIMVNPVLAAKTPPPPSELSSYNVGIQSLDLLMPSSCVIAEVGDGKVALSGDTFTQFTVDTVGLKLYLQKWDGSSWVDVDSSPMYEEENSDYVSGVYDCSVESGYYYRAKGLHTAKDGSKYEEQESFSSYTYVE